MTGRVKRDYEPPMIVATVRVDPRDRAPIVEARALLGRAVELALWTAAADVPVDELVEIEVPGWHHPTYKRREP